MQVGGLQWIREWLAWGVYGLHKESQARIPCKVGCLHLTGCTTLLPKCMLPGPPFPSLPPHFPSIFPSPPFTLFSSPDSIFTLYCRVSQQSRLHWSGHCGHIPDCEKAAEELEGEVGGDRGPTFSWENNYVGDQKENEDNCTFVLEKTPWGLVGCSQNQNPGSRPLMTMMIIKMTVLTAVLMTITMIMMDNIDMCEY